MAQATKSAQIPASAPGWATPGNGIIGMVLLTLLVIASAMVVGVFSGRSATVGDAAVPDVPSYSRLDDYGLRHPNAVGAGTTDSRLDDYGLRHPNAVGAGTTDSRLDDYGLRHPKR